VNIAIGSAVRLQTGNSATLILLAPSQELRVAWDTGDSIEGRNKSGGPTPDSCLSMCPAIAAQERVASRWQMTPDVQRRELDSDVWISGI